MTNNRSIRERSQRLDVEFHRRRRRIDWNWTVAAVASLLTGGWLVTTALPGKQAVYSSGPTSTAHRMFEHDCAKCHEPWSVLKKAVTVTEFTSTAPDAKCVACHAGPPHQERQIPGHEQIGCATCHREHRGDIDLAYLADRHCVNCHADLKNHGSTGTFADRIERFDGSGRPGAHPEFAIHRILHPAEEHRDLPMRTPPQLEKFVRRDRWGKSDEQQQFQDRARIRFNHHVHLAPSEDLRDPNVLKIDGESLTCTHCHQPDKAGEFMLPISFEAHCARCHQLTFDNARFPDKVVPHERPEVVRGFLTDLYTINLLNQPKPADDSPSPTEQTRPPLASRGFVEDEEDIQIVNDRVAAAEHQVYLAEHALIGREGKGACNLCHEVSNDGGTWQITPPGIPERWLDHSRFNHATHRMLDCNQCHAVVDGMMVRRVEDSQSTGDVLLPKLAVCLGCHSSASDDRRDTAAKHASARSNCVECHTYHKWSDKHFAGTLGRDLNPTTHATQTISDPKSADRAQR